MAEPAANPNDPLIGDLRRAGLLPLLVLHFACAEPVYGSQIKERIETLVAGALQVNPNTLYPLLGKLEEQGFLLGQWEHPTKRSRRFYAITDAGRAERDRLAEELVPRLERIKGSIDAIRREVSQP